jgi:type IV pilus assembly protein PilY1
MQTANPTHRAAMRMLASVLTWALVAGQVMQPVYAVLTPLGDIPIAAKVAAKPNIVYTLDDSGSMASNYIPDFVNDGPSTVNGISIPVYCRGSIQLNSAMAPFYNKDAGGTYNLATTACGLGGGSYGSPFNFPPFYASGFNHIAYNPGVTYTPPIKANGLPLSSGGAGVTDALGNQIDITKVQTDPYNSPASNVNLIPGTLLPAPGSPYTVVAVPLYCNSDWPIISNPPAVGQVGDSAGEYSAGAGGHCRINGTKYDANANGATAISDDYNYPWPKVGATVGAAGSPNDAAYFWRNDSQRQLWCDKTSANWPQTCNGGWSCTKGGKYTAPVASQPQTCYFAGSADSCAAYSTTYSPVGCNTNPAYDLGGCVAGTEQTCLACTATTACTLNNPYNYGYCHLTANGGPPGSGGDGSFCYCLGSTCTLPACPLFAPAPTNANCSKGTLTQKCTLNAGACTDRAFDSVNLVDRSYTLLDDSNLTNGGTGTICRHNNFNYGTGALPGAYPSGKFISPVSSGCPTDIPTSVLIPRHYYVVDSVDFCTTPNTTANAQWNGFGTSACQGKNDFATHKFVKYGQFHRIDLVDGRNYPFVDAVNGAAGTRTYAEEAINYANWYAYYRTRLLAAKTTSSIAFSFLDNTYRVGFHDLGTSSTTIPPIWVDVGDFEDKAPGTHRSDWYKALFGISVSNFSTYTMSAMLRIGNLFKTGGASGLPSTVNPLPAAAKDPITLSCQSNYHVLITDGFTNEPTLQTPAWIGDQDGNEPASFPPPVSTTDNALPNLNLLLGKPWPTPYVQQTKAVSNTLADIATYYWATDLRPTLKNDVPAWATLSGDQCTAAAPCPPLFPPPTDLDWTKDVAWWQHVTFSAISFGSEGILDASRNDNTATGTLPLIYTGALNWPDLTNPNQPINPPTAKGAAGVDDLWHATVNSRGMFVYAKSPVEVAYGLAAILNGITNGVKARTGVAFNGQVLDQNNNVIFEPKIEPYWGGDLIKVEIDPVSGVEVKQWWKASTTLASQIDPAVAKIAEPWMDQAFRRVVTIGKSGLGDAFRDTRLTAAQLASLSPDPTKQKKIIAYLRGGSTYGGTVIEGTKPGQFRQRHGPLGDITNAQPLIVNAPDRNYRDATDPGYSAFVAATAARQTVVVAPANDGMVHVFDAGPMPKAASGSNPAIPVSAGGGTELFGYIPTALFRGVAGSVATEDVTAIQALTYQDAGAPIYHHHFYVDSSPRSADVDFGNGAGLWHTVVVGGLGKGGNSYYALDLTDVTVANEATAAAKVLWEWNNPDSDVASGASLASGTSPGFSYGRPVIVKVRDSAYAYGRWVVIVTGGYNNSSGKGKVFFLDAATGKLLSTITTSAGTGADPSGLAQTHAFVKDETNQTAEQIYGGDLLGNVWRIDVSATDSYLTAPAVLFAQLTDPGGKPQPVTTAPQIEIDLNNGVDRYVFVGTGRLLHPDDLTDPPVPQQQTFYAIRDGSLSKFDPPAGPNGIQPRTGPGQMAPINADEVSAIVGGAPNGWYQDLPNNPADLYDPVTSPKGRGAERIVIDPSASVNVATYIGTMVQNDPCVISLPAFLYARNFTTGETLLEDSGGTLMAYLPFGSGGVGFAGPIGAIQADGSMALGGLMTPETGGGTSPVKFKNPITGPGIRWSWRLLTGE